MNEIKFKFHPKERCCKCGSLTKVGEFIPHKTGIIENTPEHLTVVCCECNYTFKRLPLDSDAKCSPSIQEDIEYSYDELKQAIAYVTQEISNG